MSKKGFGQVHLKYVDIHLSDIVQVWGKQNWFSILKYPKVQYSSIEIT